jgi:hypothetical protein
LLTFPGGIEEAVLFITVRRNILIFFCHSYSSYCDPSAGLWSTPIRQRL